MAKNPDGSDDLVAIKASNANRIAAIAKASTAAKSKSAAAAKTERAAEAKAARARALMEAPVTRRQLASLGSAPADARIPRGFANKEAFDDFSGALRSGLSRAGYGKTEPIFQGSSVTGIRYKLVSLSGTILETSISL